MTRSPDPSAAGANKPLPPDSALDRSADLETILEAWHGAAVRLEQTHSALRAEVARLTQELETKNRELARRNRLADLGRMASHVAHEVRNNLVPVALYLSLLKRRISDDPGSLDVVDKIQAGMSALDCTVNDLLHFTAEREPQWESVRLSDLVAEVVAQLQPQLEAQSIRAHIDVPGSHLVTVDRTMVRRALMNLALNAVDAMPDGGELHVTSCLSSGGLDLEVADSGCGLNDESLRRAFEPFYTTKSRGTGLGLAIVYRVAEAHHGRVTVANCPEGGAAFTLLLPRRAMETAA
jgi:signal transduction histidine kinase